MIRTNKRTYGSKKSENGPINHKDILRNAPDTSTLFEALSATNIKKYRKDNSYLFPTNGRSLGFGRKRILVPKKAAISPKPKIKVSSTDTSSDDSLHVKHHSNDLFDQLRLSLKGPNDPFEQLLAGDRSRDLPAEINPRLNITTDSAASSPEKPVVHQRDPSFKPSKVKKKRKSSKRKKLAPVLPFGSENDSDSIIHHKFLIENDANKKKISPELKNLINLPSCSKTNAFDNFATNSSSDNIPETHKECDNSQIESIRNYSPIINSNLRKNYCDHLGTPTNNIPPLSSTPYRKSRLPTYIQEHELSAISTSENSSQGKTHYYSINSLKKVEKEAGSTASYKKIKDDFLKSSLVSDEEIVDFKMSSEPLVNVTNMFADPVVDVTDIFTAPVVDVTDIFTDPVVNVTDILTDPVVNVTDIFTDPVVNVTDLLTDPVVNVTDMFAQPVVPSSILPVIGDESVNMTDTCAQPGSRKYNRIMDNESSILTESGDESVFRGYHLGTKKNDSDTLFYGFPSKNNSGQDSPVLFDSILSDTGCNGSQIVLGRSENNKPKDLIISNIEVVENSKLKNFNESEHLNNLTDDSDGMNSSFDSDKHNLTGKHSTNSMEYNLFNDSKLAKVPIVVLIKLDDRFTDDVSKSFELESNYNTTDEIDSEANNFNKLDSSSGNVHNIVDASELSHLGSDKIQIEKDECNISHSSSENVEINTNISKILCLSPKILEKDDNDSKNNCINDKDIENDFNDSKVLNLSNKKTSKSVQNSPECDTSINNKMFDVSKSSLDKLKENLEPNEQLIRKIVDSPIVLRNKKTVYRGLANKNKKPARKATKSTSLDKKTSNDNKISSAEITQPEKMPLEEMVKSQEAFKELEMEKFIMEDKIDEISIFDASDYSAINKDGNQYVTMRNTQYSLLDFSAFSCLNRTQDSPNISVIDYDRTVSEKRFENSEDTFFYPLETFSNKKQTSFNKRETFCNQHDTTSNRRETSSNRCETFSNQRQSHFNKRQTFDNKREAFSNKRETFYNRRETYNNDDLSSRPSIVLEPGKRWERSLRILRNLNRSNMTLDDTVDYCNATIQENPHPKGRKYRESVAHLIDLQSKDGRRNSLADFSRTFHDAFSTTRVHSVTIVEEQTLLPDEIDQDISQLSNSSAEELLSDACNDTAINLSRLAISKVARSSLLDKEEPAWSALNARDVVLRRCNQTHPLPFDECYPDKKLQKCCKIGEGVYGEVFLYKNEDDPTNPIVMKVIPIEGTQLVNGDHQKKFEEIISEIVIAMELSDLRNNEENNTLGFNKVNRVRCVKGRYPDRLVELWELYDELKGSENDCPTLFDAGQLFIILELANGGKDLEAFKFTTAEQSYYLFFQIAFALAVAEEAFQFEHRDLHWGNVLISFAEKAEVTYKLRGEPYSIPTAGVLGNIIDFTLSRVSVPASHTIYNDLAKDPDLFAAEGDYQFEIYRLMRQKNGNLWQHFEPYTNILWLHYTLDKMITALRYERADTCVHGIFISKLQYLKEKILQYDSCVDFVTNEECFTIADI